MTGVKLLLAPDQFPVSHQQLSGYIPESNHLPMECRNPLSRRGSWFPGFWLTVLQGILYISGDFSGIKSPLRMIEATMLSFSLFGFFFFFFPQVLFCGIHFQVDHLHWIFGLEFCFQGSWAKTEEALERKLLGEQFGTGKLKMSITMPLVSGLVIAASMIQYHSWDSPMVYLDKTE